MTSTFNYSSYYVDDDIDIKKTMDESYRASIPLQQQFWNEADIDVRFRAGDQTLWSQIYGTLPLQNRRTFMFNRVRRVINLPIGYQRRNRKTTIVTPLENSDQETADIFSNCLQWANNTSNAYETLSDAFEGALVSGFNLLHVWMDYRNDPINGDIRIENFHHNGILIDPTFKKRDLSDANFIWTRKWISKKQAASLIRDRAEEIMKLDTLGYRDDKFMFLPENFQYSLKNLVPYDEYWYLTYKDIKQIVDLDSGEAMEWKGDEKGLKRFLEMYPQVRAVDAQKQTCNLAICVAGRVMYHGPNPYEIDRYPFVGVYGYFEPDIPYYALKMQGMIRGLRDAQFLYNRRKVIELDILESQINSGLKFKENALKDPRDAFLSGQGRMLAIRDNASMDDVQQIQPPQIPPTMIQLSQTLGEEIQQISGVNEELLGSATDEKAGVLSMLRQGAGLTTLQVLFDQLDFSQKQLGQLYMDLIQANFSAGKIQRITGKQPSEQFYNKNFQKYDCVVEEGILTASQKQMQFQQLLSIREMGIPVPTGILLESLTVQNKDELIKAIQQEEQQQAQMQQAQQQSEMQKEQVLANSLAAKAESDRALAQERIDKIQTDAAVNIERIARSQHEEDAATLDKIRAAKELQDMDLTQLERMLQILRDIKGEEQTKLSTENVA